MTTLQEWIERFKQYDPDDWTNRDELRATFSQKELDANLEAEIVFRTEGGQVNRVTILLLNSDEEVVVELAYSTLQIDTVALTEFIRDAVFPGDPE